MLLALSSEGTAAILGALAGGGIAIVGQSLFGIVGMFRARRVAAQIIYAELVGNLANVVPATQGLGWTSSKPEALRAAWDTYGARLLLPWHRAHDVGTIAAAYNRVDDIAWMAENGHISRGDDYSNHIDDIYAGVFVSGMAAGYGESELADRLVPVERIRALISENAARARASRLAGRGERWRRRLRRIFWPS